MGEGLQRAVKAARKTRTTKQLCIVHQYMGDKPCPACEPNHSERPIIFSGEMVRAILDGRKTQTRRIVKPQPEPMGHDQFVTAWAMSNDPEVALYTDDPDLLLCCPYGVAGDRLWVRETWRTLQKWDCLKPSHLADDCSKITYEADPENRNKLWAFGKLRPSIFMPRWASCITLEITKVWVERLQDIGEEDALSEGSYLQRCPCLPKSKDRTPIERLFSQTGCHIHGTEYKALWDSLHGKGAWEKNPWVWVLEFRRA